MFTDLEKLNRFIKERDEFSFGTFGTPEARGCEPPLLHLQDEIQELIDNPDDNMEWADCFLLLIDAARRKGHSLDDLLDFALAKLAINRNRKWEKQPNGVYYHIKNPA